MTPEDDAIDGVQPPTNAITPVQKADPQLTRRAATPPPDCAGRTAAADQAFTTSYLHGDIAAALPRYGEIRFKYAGGKVLVDKIVDNKQISGSDTSVFPQDMLAPDARGGHVHGAGTSGTMDNLHSIDQKPGVRDWEYPKATGVAYYADTYGLVRLNYDDDNGFSYDVLATPEGTGPYQNKAKLDGVIVGWNNGLKAGTLIPTAA